MISVSLNFKVQVYRSKKYFYFFRFAMLCFVREPGISFWNISSADTRITSKETHAWLCSKCTQNVNNELDERYRCCWKNSEWNLKKHSLIDWQLRLRIHDFITPFYWRSWLRWRDDINILTLFPVTFTCLAILLDLPKLLLFIIV